MATDLQAPRRDEVALEETVFSRRSINFFEDIVTAVDEINQTLSELQSQIDNLDVRVTAIEALVIP